MGQLKYWDGSAWQPAATGVVGERGGVPYTFSTTTTDADPGTGVIRYNSLTIGSVSQIFIDNTDSNGTSQTAWYDTWDDSASAIGRYLTIQSRTQTGTTVNVFTVTGVTSSTGYYKISVGYVSGSLPGSAETLSIAFSRTGDTGTTASATDGEIIMAYRMFTR